MSKVTIKETLAVVNKARKALNMPALKEIPVGFVSEPDNCPIHNAFGELRVDVLGEHLALSSRDSARIMAKTWGTKVLDAQKVNEKSRAARNAAYEHFQACSYESEDVQDKVYDAILQNNPVFDDAKRWVVVAPKEIRQFVSRFDNGDFPSLMPKNQN